jgi:hypothetical protein
VYLSITIRTKINAAQGLALQPARAAPKNIMTEALLPGSISAPQAQALANILAVTRREWQVAEPDPLAGAIAIPTPGQSNFRSCQRRDQLAWRAARAFEAQVMALRCRQAFVA